MTIYMKIDGIKGNVDAEGHQGWIEASSLNWGVKRRIQSTTGLVKDRESSAPAISSVRVSKLMDAASPYIFTEACTGKGKKIEIHLVKTDAGKLESYMEYKLDDALIADYSVNTAGDRPTEALSLNFTKLEMKYIPWKETPSRQ